MHKSRIILLCMAILLVTQLACVGFLDLFQGKFWCEANGGIWIDEDSNPESWNQAKYEFCDETKDETKNDEPSDSPSGNIELEDCWVQEQANNWNYEILSSEEGQFCNAKFVYTNTADQTVAIIFRESWDSNAQDSIQWNNVLLEPGENWERRSSYAWRPDDPQGDTFNYITQMMVTYYSPGCSWLTFDQETLWEAISTEMPIPCE